MRTKGREKPSGCSSVVLSIVMPSRHLSGKKKGPAWTFLRLEMKHLSQAHSCRAVALRATYRLLTTFPIPYEFSRKHLPSAPGRPASLSPSRSLGRAQKHRVRVS